uniref:Ferric oxidoreductase domain-containing protein n=1 Tax=Candidozyma auris TaxID=498019 RepID=A0A0L0NP63_CANAR
MDVSFLSEYFHYPDSKSKEYKDCRQNTTNRFGEIMGWVSAVFLLGVTFQNYLLATGHWYFNKVHVLGPINSMCDRINSCGREGSVINRILRGITKFLKHTAYVSYLNLLAITQIVLWSSVFTVLALLDINGGDLIFLAKRLGRLSVVTLPTVFFLTIRPSPLPNTLYLSLLPIHKWLSRGVIVLAIIHTILYLGFFSKNGTWQKAWKLENLYGWGSLAGFLMIIVTSLLKIRDRTYKLFFFNHYFWSWVIVLLLPFHVRPVKTTYVNILNIAILAYQIFYRVQNTRTSEVGDFKVTHVSPNLALVDFPNNLIKIRANNPGAHVRITDHSGNILKRLYKQIIPNYHPYTLVSLPLDRSQKLIVRKGAFQWVDSRRYKVCGSFDPNLLLVKTSNNENSRFSISKLGINARKMLIVVGGSAISFAIPLLRVLNYHGVPVKILWVIRDYRDISILRHFEGYLHGDDFEIFVTGNPSEVSESSPLSGMPSYGTFQLLSRKPSTCGSEHNEHSRLTYTLDEESNLNQELENVDVDLSDEDMLDDEENRDCTIQLLSPLSQYNEQFEDSIEFDEDDAIGQDMRSTLTRKSSRSHSINERFNIDLEKGNVSHTQFENTVKRLNLENRIYKGRPKLNYRYYNWCVNQHDIFTQCSGPQQLDGSGLICCRDIPGRNKIRTEQSLPDAEKVWVISAGPKSLVKNVKLWASENGLKYHEEAFYV